MLSYYVYSDLNLIILRYGDFATDKPVSRPVLLDPSVIRVWTGQSTAAANREALRLNNLQQAFFAELKRQYIANIVANFEDILTQDYLECGGIAYYERVAKVGCSITIEYGVEFSANDILTFIKSCETPILQSSNVRLGKTQRLINTLCDQIDGGLTQKVVVVARTHDDIHQHIKPKIIRELIARTFTIEIRRGHLIVSRKGFNDIIIHFTTSIIQFERENTGYAVCRMD